MSTPVVRSVSVGASAADAFDAFTRVSDLLSWLCEGALVGLRPGGNWAVGFTNKRGITEATVLGKIVEFERGRRLVVDQISYEPREGEPLSGIRLELTFEAEGERGCVVTVAQDVPDAGPAYARYSGEAGTGWEASLAELKKYLEGPRERRILIEAGLPEN
ncbi:MAG TPA: SRPBCC domain-containing protein [Thermoanaerobaculia bacterium]|nr:SRPBCC domain-containing protein [Thermoanaerobaculia bacterium]